jgi:hypothetical protein
MGSESPARGVAIAELQVRENSWENRRDDFIHRSLRFEVIRDGFRDGELAGAVGWNPSGHQLPSVDQQPRTDSLLYAVIA